MSAINKTTIFKRTSLIVYEADIFNCSQQYLARNAQLDEGNATSPLYVARSLTA